MSTTPHIRAYLNPQPALSEVEQKAIVAPWNPNEIYVEGRAGESREEWIESLREGDIALVPELFVLAKAAGRKDARYADMLRAEREIADAGAILTDASTREAATDRRAWSKMRDRANDRLSGAVRKGKAGRKKLGYTDTELERMNAVRLSKDFANWEQRREAMIGLGIKPPGRSWFWMTLPTLVNSLGVVKETLPARIRRRKSSVYFVQDGRKVKIGHSVDPSKIVSQLGRGNHRHMALLGTVPGGAKRESALHKKFAQFRVKGEWFKFSPEIKAYIARYARKPRRKS